MGGADDHDGPRVHRRGPVLRRLHPLGHPGARRPAHVQVAGHRHRPARGDRPPRRRRGALRPAGDVLHPGRALLGREGPAGPGAGQQAVQRRALRAAADRASLGAQAAGRARPSRGHAASRTAGSSRACSAIEADTAARIEDYDFSHAALGLYDFVYGELCDWYLELVKHRLSPADSGARRALRRYAATLLAVLRETVALAHPVIPFVTEELWRYLGGRGRCWRAAATRTADPSLIDPDAEIEIGAGDRGGHAGAWLARQRRCAARADRSRRALERRGLRRRRDARAIARLARLELDRRRRREPVASSRDPRRQRRDPLRRRASTCRRPSARRAAPGRSSQSEIERVQAQARERGLRRKAPAAVVEAERARLQRLASELEAL